MAVALHAVSFTSQRTKEFARLANVLQASAAANSPATPLTIHAIADNDDELSEIAYPTCKQKWIDNARKAKHQCRLVQAADDGELLGLLDIDTFVLRDLSKVESLDFDLAYTVRSPGSLWKISTGVYFVRVSDAVKRYVGRWYATVLRMLSDYAYHLEWREGQEYGGIHQAALGALMTTEPNTLRLLALDCCEWNALPGDWEFNLNPRVVHVTGEVREWCLRHIPAPHLGAQRWADKWKAIEMQITNSPPIGLASTAASGSKC